MAQYRNSRFVALKDVLDDMIREMRIGGKMDEMKVRTDGHLYHQSYYPYFLQTGKTICLSGIIGSKAGVIHGENQDYSQPE